jgi:F-type H+-transporting ATPase subunit delta
MAKKNYARRYAQALFEIALEHNELDKWQADLWEVAAIAGDAKARAFLENPGVSPAAKAGLLSRVLKEKNPLVQNLISLLLARDSLGMARDIALAYHERLNAFRGIEQARVTTALPIDEQQAQDLEQRIGVLVGKKVRATFEVDPRVVGGFVARIDGKLLDGSTRTRLAMLKKTMAGAG